MECTIKTMDKADLERMLQEKYRGKIEPVRKASKKKGMRGFYEQMMRPHRIVHKMKDGRLKIKDLDGTVRWEG